MAEVSSKNMKVLVDQHYLAATSIVSKYPNSRSAVLPLLFLVQGIEVTSPIRECGTLPNCLV